MQEHAACAGGQEGPHWGRQLAAVERQASVKRVGGRCGMPGMAAAQRVPVTTKVAKCKSSLRHKQSVVCTHPSPGRRT